MNVIAIMNHMGVYFKEECVGWSCFEVPILSRE